MTRSDNIRTVIVFRDEEPGVHQADDTEVFHLVAPLLEANGVSVGKPVQLDNGFVFSIWPQPDGIRKNEQDAIAAAMSCLRSFGFAPFITERAFNDDGDIDNGVVVVGIATLSLLGAAGILAVGKLIRGVGRIVFGGQR